MSARLTAVIFKELDDFVFEFAQDLAAGIESGVDFFENFSAKSLYSEALILSLEESFLHSGGCLVL